MKKTTLFLACCIGLMVFSSCKKDPELPTIEILEKQGCVTENAQVYSGVEITVGFSCTGENLTQIEVILTQNDSILARHSDNLSDSKADPTPSITYKHTFTLETTGSVTVKGTLTDAQGQVATISFDINYNEKPNMKFVGHYEGDIFINGNYSADVSAVGLQTGTLENIPFTTIADVVTGDNIDEVAVTITLGDQPNFVKGIVDGNDITFEDINSTFVFDYTYDGLGFPINIPIELDVVYSLHGTLNDGHLDLEGECQGNGEIEFMGGVVSGPVKMDGVLNGGLNKVW